MVLVGRSGLICEPKLQTFLTGVAGWQLCLLLLKENLRRARATLLHPCGHLDLRIGLLHISAIEHSACHLHGSVLCKSCSQGSSSVPCYSSVRVWLVTRGESPCKSRASAKRRQNQRLAACTLPSVTKTAPEGLSWKGLKYLLHKYRGTIRPT